MPQVSRPPHPLASPPLPPPASQNTTPKAQVAPGQLRRGGGGGGERERERETAHIIIMSLAVPHATPALNGHSHAWYHPPTIRATTNQGPGGGGHRAENHVGNGAKQKFVKFEVAPSAVSG